MREEEVKPLTVLWFTCPRDGTAVRLATHNTDDPIWRGVVRNGLACPICTDEMDRSNVPQHTWS